MLNWFQHLSRYSGEILKQVQDDTFKAADAPSDTASTLVGSQNLRFYSLTLGDGDTKATLPDKREDHYTRRDSVIRHPA